MNQLVTKAPKLAEAFARAKQEGRAALVLYITGGYPSLDRFGSVLGAISDYADIIEIGIPFSDPLADGPTIQAASEHVMRQKTTTDDIFDVLAECSGELDVPLAAMGYWNTVFHYGMEAYAAKCQKAGVTGVILPDLPPEEASGWIATAEAHGIDTVFLAAPTSTEERLHLIGQRTRGFLYCVSLAGVTGARDQLPPDLAQFVARVRASTDQPVAVGFGVSTPGHVSEVAGLADGVIVGSALIKAIDVDAPLADQLGAIKEYLGPLKQALGKSPGKR